MKKRNDIKIYELCHKKVDYGFWDNALYTPIQVGASCNNENVCKLKDNEGEDNISEWNPVYAELTGLYEIWKKYEAKNFASSKKVQALGICQYRRRLKFDENISVEDLFQNCDAIFPEPLFLSNSLEEQYGNCHNIEDLKFAETIVKEMYPEYAEDWDLAIKQNCYIFYSNSFVMKYDDFNNYCTWLFSILDEFKKRKGWETVEDVRNYVAKNIEEKKHHSARGLDYQMQIFGFLAERLATVFIFHNFEKIQQVPYTKMEKGIL